MEHRFSAIFMAMCMAAHAFALDTIVLRNGDIISGTVAKVGLQEVEYRKASNPKGPVYTIAKGDILSIVYENGEKEMFDTPAPLVAAQPSGPAVSTAPSADNASMIEKSRKVLQYTGKRKGSDAKEALVKFAFTDASVVSTDDYEITFEWLGDRDLIYPCCVRTIFIRNKSDRPLYIDLGSSYRVSSTGESHIYFKADQAAVVSQGKGGGVGVNLGGVASAMGVGGGLGSLASGISVGANKGSSVQKEVFQERVIMIPPHAKKALTEHKNTCKNDREYYNENNIVISHAEDMRFKALSKGFMKSGEVRVYDEADAPFRFDYSLCMSSDPDFANASQAKFALYTQQIIGDVSGIWHKGIITVLLERFKPISAVYLDDNGLVVKDKTVKRMKGLAPNLDERDIMIGIKFQ